MDWLQEINIAQTKKIKGLGLKEGWFVQLSDEFGDVWHEVKTVFDSACVIYKPRDSKNTEITTEYTSFYLIRKSVDFLPKNNIGSAFLKSGAYSHRRNNLKDIPKHYLK